MLMKRAERIIRQQIDELTIERIAPRKRDIEQAIQFMYWQGAFRKRKYEKMKKLLTDKYALIMHEYEQKISDDWDRDYERMKRSFELK